MRLFNTLSQQISSITAGASFLELHVLSIACASVSDCATAESLQFAHASCSLNYHADLSTASTCSSSSNHGAAGDGLNASTALTPEISSGILSVIGAVPA